MKLISHPILCNYYLTYRCNATCSFCDIWEKPSPFVKVENVEKNLSDLKKLGVKVIDFTGGEPLLHPELPTFLDIAKRKKFITTVTTNGIRYPKLAEKLKGKIDMLHFSLDAADRETHDNMRGVKCFDKVIESIEIAKSLGERPDILCTVFEGNFEEIEKIYETITFKNNLVLILNPVFEYNSVDTLGNLNADYLKKLLKFSKKKLVYLNEAFIDLRLEGGNKIEKPICKAASSTLVISPENKLVLPCYHLGKEEFEINDNLYELYHSDKIKKLISEEGKLAECEGCTINCYMQPSFAVEINRFFWKALPSTLKYNFMKGTWKNLL